MRSLRCLAPLIAFALAGLVLVGAPAGAVASYRARSAGTHVSLVSRWDSSDNPAFDRVAAACEAVAAQLAANRMGILNAPKDGAIQIEFTRQKKVRGPLIDGTDPGWLEIELTYASGLKRVFSLRAPYSMKAFEKEALLVLPRAIREESALRSVDGVLALIEDYKARMTVAASRLGPAYSAAVLDALATLPRRPRLLGPRGRERFIPAAFVELLRTEQEIAALAKTAGFELDAQGEQIEIGSGERAAVIYPATERARAFLDRWEGQVISGEMFNLIDAAESLGGRVRLDIDANWVYRPSARVPRGVLKLSGKLILDLPGGATEVPFAADFSSREEGAAILEKAEWADALSEGLGEALAAEAIGSALQAERERRAALEAPAAGCAAPLATQRLQQVSGSAGTRTGT